MVLWHCCTFASSSDESAKAKPKNNGTKSVEGSNALATNGAQKSDANSTGGSSAKAFSYKSGACSRRPAASSGYTCR